MYALKPSQLSWEGCFFWAGRSAQGSTRTWPFHAHGLSAVVILSRGVPRTLGVTQTQVQARDVTAVLAVVDNLQTRKVRFKGKQFVHPARDGGTFWRDERIHECLLIGPALLSSFSSQV